MKLDAAWVLRPVRLEARLAYGFSQTVLGNPRPGAGVELSVGVLASRPSFVVDDLGQVYQPRWVFGRGSLGLSVQLW